MQARQSRVNPRYGDAYLARADYLRFAQKLKESAIDCDQAIQLEPRNSDILRQSAVIRKNSRNGPATVSAFEKAISLDPHDTRNYDDYAEFLSERKNSVKVCAVVIKHFKSIRKTVMH